LPSGQIHAPGTLPSGKKPPPKILWIGEWVSPRASLDAVLKRKKSLACPCWDSNASHPACSLVTILTELPQLIKEAG